MNARDEGLGLSVAIYAAALVGGAAVFLLPAYLATRPTVVPNAVATATYSADQLYDPHDSHKIFPVARLQSKPIVDPAVVAELNAEATEAKKIRAVRVHVARHGLIRRPRPTAHVQAEMTPPPRPAYPNISAIF